MVGRFVNSPSQNCLLSNYQPTLDDCVCTNTTAHYAHTHTHANYLCSCLNCDLPPFPAVCDANIDMVFMLDQSGSVGQYNHDTALYFLQDVVSFYNISPNATQVPSISACLIVLLPHDHVYSLQLFHKVWMCIY